MAERLTVRYKNFRCPKCGEVISSAPDVEFYQSRLQAQPEIAKALAKLAHYEDLEEQDRLVILPDGMNFRKLLKTLTECGSGCPIECNLVNQCELSCFECWLAALKGVENE